MYCPSCGEEISDDSVFCRNCGENIESTAEKVSSKSKTPETAAKSKTDQPGSHWEPSQRQLDGEQVIKSYKANRTQSEGRAVGGTLYLTDQRLLFEPHSFDAERGGEKVSIDLDAIESASKESRGGRSLKDTFMGGGLRKRLRVEVKNQTPELFVVNDLSNLIDQVNTIIDGGSIKPDTGNSKGWISTLGKIGAYLVGAFLILSGLSGMADSVLAGLVFLAGGIFALPIVRSKLDEYRGISIGTLATVGIVIGAVIIGGAVYNVGDVNSNSGPNGDSQAATQPTMTSTEQVIEKPATDLVILLEQFGAGWSGSVDGNQTSANGRYYNSGDDAVLDTTAQKYTSVSKAQQQYEERVNTIQESHSTETVNIGDQAIFYQTGKSGWILFRDTNVVSQVRYSLQYGTPRKDEVVPYAELMHENFPQ